MMDEKTEISCKLLCNVCLSVGNTLYEIKNEKLLQFYLSALNEIPVSTTSYNISPNMCFDCKALLKKAMAFKEQVKESYIVLQSFINENTFEYLLKDVSRPPRLSVTSNEPITVCEDNYQDESIKNEVDTEWVDSDDINYIPSQNETDALTEPIIQVEKSKKKKKHKTNSLTNHTQSEEPGIKNEIDLWTEIGDSKDFKQIKDEIESIINEPVRKKKKRHKDKEMLKIKKDKKFKTIDLSYDEVKAERDSNITKATYINSEYKCGSCIIGFKYYKSYKLHVDSKHSKNIGSYRCPICKTFLPNLQSFTTHYKRHTRRYECKQCGKRTLDIKVMQQHCESMHNKTPKQYKCEYCGKISNSFHTHRYHKDTHKARLQCTQCSKTFTHRGALKNHKISVHEFHNKFPCSLCSKIFRWQASLNRHIAQYHNKSKCEAMPHCELCDVSFTSVSNYQRHLKNSLKHVSQDQLRFICDHCKRHFSDKTKLRDHIEEKHLHRSFQCHICLKTSKNRVGLDQHIRNVHKRRPNNKICHHCGKGFPTKTQLDSHIRSHTGERPFICEYCPSTFSQQSNLYKHNRQVHLNMSSKKYSLCKKKEEKPTDPLESNPLPTEYPVVFHYSPERSFII